MRKVVMEAALRAARVIQLTEQLVEAVHNRLEERQECITVIIVEVQWAVLVMEVREGTIKMMEEAAGDGLVVVVRRMVLAEAVQAMS